MEKAYDISFWGAEGVARAKDPKTWPQNRQKQNAGNEIWRIQDPSTIDGFGLCNFCRTINFNLIMEEQIKFLDNRDEIPLGYLEDINLNRANCSFCRLVVNTICVYTGTEQPTVWQDGERVKCDLRPVPAGFGKGHDLWLVTMPVLEPSPRQPSNLAQPLGPSMVRARPLNTPLPWSMNQTFRGQLRIHPIKEQFTGITYGRRMNERVSLQRLKTWTEETPRLHPNIAGLRLQYKESHVEIPPQFTLIDVCKQCLVPGLPGAEYVALSYCWGKVARPFLRTLIANKAKLEVPGGLLSSDPLLPRTIRDSIWLVQALGLQYLWVDSLCIVQDDYKSKEEQLDAMSIVYSSAKFTIVAAAGNDADAGLPGIGLSARSNHQHIEDVQGLKLANRLSSGSEALDSSFWNTRGWTYQERMMSQALLIFTAQQVYYRYYGRLEYCEDVWPDDSGNPGEPDSHVVLLNQLNWHRYAMSVVNYNSRTLSFQQDGLAAFAGIGTSLFSAFRSTLTLGLPDTAFDHALLWIPRGPLRRREFTEPEQPYFPSWSWAGWIGLVGYDQLNLLSSRVLWKNFAKESQQRQGTSGTFFQTRDIVPGPHWNGWTQWSGGPINWKDISETPARDYCFPIAPVEDRKQVTRLDPEHAGHLQFWTQVAHFSLMESSKSLPNILFGGQLQSTEVMQKGIKNHDGEEVGVIYLNCSIPSKPDYEKFTFVLLSRASTSYAESRKVANDSSAYQCAIGEYTVASSLIGSDIAGDQAQFERDKKETSSQWGIYNVMLVQQRDGISERLGIGTISIKSFHAADPKRELIVLK